MVPLGLIAIAGFWFAGWNHIPATQPREPDGLLGRMQLALFACVGFDVAAIVSGEMRNPRRDLPVSILGGLGDLLPAVPPPDAGLLRHPAGHRGIEAPAHRRRAAASSGRWARR